jgi:hypothetical protein
MQDQSCKSDVPHFKGRSNQKMGPRWKALYRQEHRSSLNGSNESEHGNSPGAALSEEQTWLA